jgi:hypothetical protein
MVYNKSTDSHQNKKPFFPKKKKGSIVLLYAYDR